MTRPSFSLVQLGYFVAVAEVGSITLAAERLRIAQSAVSTAISNLEDQFSLQLFIRDHAKGVRLTDAGEKFLLKARELLAHAVELSEFGRDLGGSLSGELRVACFAFAAPFFLPPLLSKFNRAYPGVQVTVREDHLEGVQRALMTASADVALLYDVNLSPRLDCEIIARYPPYVLLPKGHNLANRKSVSLRELEKEPFIQIDLPISREYSALLGQQAGVRFNVAFRTSSFEMVRGLVANGHGYSILNQRFFHNSTYDGKQVITVELSDELAPINLAIARVAGSRLSRRVTAFYDICREHFMSKTAAAAIVPRRGGQICD